MAIDKNLAQAIALLHDAHGYMDALANEASDIAARAGKQEEAAVEYDAICKRVSEKKAELAGLNADIVLAERAFAEFKDLASKR